MSDLHLLATYPTPSPYLQVQASDSACSALLRLAALGGLVGGSAAAASNLRQVRDGTLDAGPALAATARAALIGAAATAAAGAVAGAAADQGLMRLALMFAVGTGVACGLDQWGRAGSGGDSA